MECKSEWFKRSFHCDMEKYSSGLLNEDLKRKGYNQPAAGDN